MWQRFDVSVQTQTKTQTIAEEPVNVIPFPDQNPMQQILCQMFEGHEVRTAIKSDKTIWFVLTDVCAVLDITNNRNVAARLRDNQKDDVRTMDAIGREQATTIISESGLYSVILKSRSPKAEPFQEWIEETVLPSLRKYGSYGVANQDKPAIDVRDPKQLVHIAMQLIDVNQELSDEVSKVRGQLAEVKPKADALDRIALADGSYNVTMAAKLLQMPPKKLFKWLSENGWIYRRTGGKNWIAYQNKIQTGLLEHKVTTAIDDATGEERVFEQVKVTSRGIAKLSEMFAKNLA